MNSMYPKSKYAKPQWWLGNYPANTVLNIILRGREDAVRLLGELKNDVHFDSNIVGPYRMTALRVAIACGSADHVGAVIQLGAKVSQSDIEFAKEHHCSESVLAVLHSANARAAALAVICEIDAMKSKR